jgi:hypothetical protein
MPLHIVSPRAAALPLRSGPNRNRISNVLFHSSRVLRKGYDVDGTKSHYETLKVPRDASPAEIKKCVRFLLSPNP